jgi:hypothetical protein
LDQVLIVCAVIWMQPRMYDPGGAVTVLLTLRLVPV